VTISPIVSFTFGRGVKTHYTEPKRAVACPFLWSKSSDLKKLKLK
jgi:hypothetical protein